MADFDDLKKRIDVFLKEVKGFTSGISATKTEVENHQSRFTELRSKQKEFLKEVNEFQPAKKIFFFDSKKARLVKSLQEEITAASKMMEKHKIPVPEEEKEEEPEEGVQPEADGTAAQAASEPKEELGEAEKPAEAAAAPAAATATAAPEAAAPAPKPRQEARPSTSAAAATAAATNEDKAEGEKDEPNDDEEEFDDEEEESEEEPNEGGGEGEANAQGASSEASSPPKPAPRQAVQQAPVVTAASAEAGDKAEEEEEEEDEVDDEEEEDADSADDDEEAAEEDDMRSLGPDEPNLFEVQQSYASQEADMLSIVQGEQLIVLRVGADGWWQARNSRGQEGLVPSTLLREVEESEDEEEEDEEEEDEEEATESLGTASAAAAAAAQSTVQNQQETESWMEDTDSGSEPVDTESNDDSLQMSLIQHVMGASAQLSPGLPAGFRNSTLAKWFYEGRNLAAQLAPKLTRSCLSFRDLQFDSSTHQLKPLASRVDKILLLQKCTFMPTELPVKVVDRFVRLCLFDGHGPVSNVHTVRAASAAAGKDAARVWTFASRLADSTPGLEFGEAYLRYNYASNHVQLLVEATVVCSEQSADGEEKLVELSIGHASVPLCDENGAPVPAKGFDLQLEGGTPFEHQIEVDPNLSKPTGLTSGTRSQSIFGSLEASFGGSQSTGLFKSAANKQPRIQLKFSQPSREVKEFMDTCPGTMIGSMAHLQLHSLYRHVLSSELAASGGGLALERSAAPLYGPCLVQFPAMADQPDLMDSIRRRWNEFAKRERSFRKPLVTEVMKQEFIRIVKSTYFLNQLKDFQPYIFGNKAQEHTRANLIQDFQRRAATDPTGVNFSLCADFIFEPFNLQEAALPVLGPHSLPVVPVVVE